MTRHKKLLAVQIFAAGAFQDKSRSPGGKGFRLKQHQKNPELPLAPYYLDINRIRSFPMIMNLVVGVYLSMKESLEKDYDLIADVPSGATPFVAILANDKRIPMISPRDAKGHGTESSIDGVYQEGQRVLLFDDVVTTTESIRNAVAILRAGKLIVEDVLVFVDREQGAQEKLKDIGIRLHSFFTVSELIKIYLEEGKISKELYEEIVAYSRWS